MKTSCDMNDKIKRRLNSVEMKVSIYKQQTIELRDQLDKERRVNAKRLETLERQVRDSATNADMNFLMERRLINLEKELGQVTNNLAMSGGFQIVGGGHQTSDSGRRESHRVPSYSFNALDSTPVRIPNLVKSMVKAEVQAAFINSTRHFEKKIERLPSIFLSIVKSMKESNLYIPIPKPSEKTGDNLKQYGRSGQKGMRKDSGSVLNKYENLRKNLDHVGDAIAKKVEDYLHTSAHPPKRTNTIEKGSLSRYDKVTTTTSYSKNTESGQFSSTVFDASMPTPNKHEELVTLTDAIEASLIDDNLESNDSFSGENPDSNETSSEGSFSSDAVDTRISGEPRPRISGKEDVGKSRGAADKEDKYDRYASPNTKEDIVQWKQNMIGDENYNKLNDERRKKALREEINQIIVEHTSVTMRLIEKEMMAKLTERGDFIKFVNDVDGHIKSLNQTAQSNSLQLQSLTQGLQTSFDKLEKLSTLDAIVKEIKTNLTLEIAGKASQERIQQSKRVSKLERLVHVYKQTQEHFNNKTQREYTAMMTKMTREKINIKALSQNLRDSFKIQISNAVEQINTTHWSELQELTRQVERNEDNTLRNGIDIGDLQKRTNGRRNRASRELKDVKETLSAFVTKTRECRKKVESLQKKQTDLNDVVNKTALAIEDLKKKFHLSQIDTWMKTNFEYDASMTDCFGDQYVRRVKLYNAHVRLVGVILCSPKRYKILMSHSIDSKFLNIGDSDGTGEDHCEFVGGTTEKNATVSGLKANHRFSEGEFTII